MSIASACQPQPRNRRARCTSVAAGRNGALAELLTSYYRLIASLGILSPANHNAIRNDIATLQQQFTPQLGTIPATDDDLRRLIDLAEYAGRPYHSRESVRTSRGGAVENGKEDVVLARLGRTRGLGEFLTVLEGALDAVVAPADVENTETVISSVSDPTLKFSHDATCLAGSGKYNFVTGRFACLPTKACETHPLWTRMSTFWCEWYGRCEHAEKWIVEGGRPVEVKGCKCLPRCRIPLKAKLVVAAAVLAVIAGGIIIGYFARNVLTTAAAAIAAGARQAAQMADAILH